MLSEKLYLCPILTSCCIPAGERDSGAQFGFWGFFLFNLLTVLGLCCSWAFSSCRERGLLFIVVPGLFSAGSVVVVHGLSCSGACGTFPDQGSNLCPLHWQVDSYPLCHQGNLSIWVLNNHHNQLWPRDLGRHAGIVLRAFLINFRLHYSQSSEGNMASKKLCYLMSNSGQDDNPQL